MKKVLFYMLTLLSTVIFFFPPSVNANWRLHKHIRGYPTEVRGIAWLNNTTFIIGGKDLDDNTGRLRKFNVDGTQYWGQSWTNDKVRCVAVPSHDPSYVVYGRENREVASRYTSNGSLRKVFARSAGGVWSLSFKRGTHFVAVGGGDGWVNLWDLQSRQNPSRFSSFRGHRNNPIRSLYYDSTNDLIYVADGDNNIDERRERDGHITFVYGSHSARVNTVDHYRRYVASGSDDNTIRIYDFIDEHLTNAFRASNGDINSIDFGPNGNLLASCGDGDSVRIWNFDKNNGRVTSLKHSFGTGADAYVVKFSPNGYYLAAGAHNGTYIYKTSQNPAAPTIGTDEEEMPLMETSLLSNYPNPFNPETWIPYQLSKPAEVTVTIHAADGKLVRTLELGQMPAGVYQDKDSAVYWNGKNEQGERVASGVYFYTLKAGEFSATKKMLIRK